MWQIIVAAAVLGFVLLILFLRKKTDADEPSVIQLPKIRKQDMTLERLKQFDGSNNGPICVAVDYKIFDVTVASHLYGPGAPYGLFAGRDASRALGTFSMGPESLKAEFDDLSDLTSSEMSSVKEWASQFEEKYNFIGRLLRPGAEPDIYTDTEEEKEKLVNSKKDN